MSAQTGRPSLPSPPPASGRMLRTRVALGRVWHDPNPVFMREMRQFARLGRTPVILALLTAMMTLLMASIGGLFSVQYAPSKVGVALHQVFFSLAFFGVTWAAPAVASSSIAGEKSGRTWEALVLTGLAPATIARGLFAASLASVTLYLVMLAPVAALPFLFGGVTATEILLGFVLLSMVGALSAALGLSISSKFSSPAAAIVMTLFLSMAASFVVYLGLGVALSFGAHTLWPGLVGGPPIWLPTAYLRADFDLKYLLFLVVTPLLGFALPAWFFYEVTVANLSDPSQDRSSGLRRWLLVTLPIVTVAGASVPLVLRASAWQAACASLATCFALLLFMACVIAGEPPSPSHRVLVAWQRERASTWRRYLGPGILRAASLLLVLGVISLGVVSVAGARASSGNDAVRVLVCGGYLIGFFVFVVGWVAWTRARANSALLPRFWLIGVLLLLAIGPWLLAAVAGAVRGSNALPLAAPSPTFVFVLVDWVGKPASDERRAILLGGAACAAAWLLAGTALLSAAGAQVQRIAASQAHRARELDAMLSAEDEALRGSAPAQS